MPGNAATRPCHEGNNSASALGSAATSFADGEQFHTSPPSNFSGMDKRLLKESDVLKRDALVGFRHPLWNTFK
jgi:hypothetical protein